jgi:hypothetical protein
MLDTAERTRHAMVTVQVNGAATALAPGTGQRSRSLLLMASAIAALSRGLAVHGAAPAVKGEIRAARLLAR